MTAQYCQYLRITGIMKMGGAAQYYQYYYDHGGGPCGRGRGGPHPSYDASTAAAVTSLLVSPSPGVTPAARRDSESKSRRRSHESS